MKFNSLKRDDLKSASCNSQAGVIFMEPEKKPSGQLAYKSTEKGSSELLAENERLKKLLEIQFRLAHAFDLPQHVEKKWLRFKSDNIPE